MSSSRAFAFVCLVSALCASGPKAHANGRFPAAQHVFVGPGRDSRSIALRTTFGFALSDDGGQNFHWICEEAFGYAGRPYDPAFVLDGNSRLLAGLVDGLVTASADRCDYLRHPDFPAYPPLRPDAGPATDAHVDVTGDVTVESIRPWIIDLDASRDGQHIVAISSSGAPGANNRVYRSDDAGSHFAALGNGLGDTLLETVEMAPANNQTVYLTGVRNDPRQVLFFRAHDGGSSFVSTAFAPPPEALSAYIAAVDPLDPATVYLRVQLAPSRNDAGALISGATSLQVTHDGGDTWTELVRSAGLMLGFAVSDDGQTLWFGGPDAADGLQRSDDRGRHWTQLSTTQVQCLRHHEGVLFVCGNYVRDGFALARSMNRGDSLEPLLDFRSLQPPFACSASSPENAYCSPRWGILQQTYGFGVMDGGLPDAGLDAGISPMDVQGAAELAPPPPGSCRCTTGTKARSSRFFYVLLALLGALSRSARKVGGARARTAAGRLKR